MTAHNTDNIGKLSYFLPRQGGIWLRLAHFVRLSQTKESEK